MRELSGAGRSISRQRIPGGTAPLVQTTATHTPKSWELVLPGSPWSAAASRTEVFLGF